MEIIIMNYKLKKYVRKVFSAKKLARIYNFLSNTKTNFYRFKSDENYIVKLVKENTGVTPNVKNPQMLFEKILWLKIHYKNPLMTICSDKYEVRNYVTRKGYKNLLTNLIGVYDNPEEINFYKLPRKAFLKCTHMSGGNQLYIKGHTNEKRVIKRFKNLLKKNYYYKSREWNYKNIIPRIIVEPFLDMSNFTDYKFFYIDGKVEYFAVVKEINDSEGMQNKNSKFNLYYPNLKPFNADVKRENFNDENFVFTPFIKEMIEVAEDLAEPFKFCRIDFLANDEKYLFGEMTFYPTGGNMILRPFEYEYYYGEKLDLNTIDKKYLIK